MFYPLIATKPQIGEETLIFTMYTIAVNAFFDLSCLSKCAPMRCHEGPTDRPDTVTGINGIACVIGI